MEQIYRRRGEAAAHRLKTAAQHGKYRRSFLRQSVFCFALFVLCLFARLAPETQFPVLRNGMQLIIETTTDFASIPDEIRQFFKVHILRQSSGRELSSKATVSADLLPPVTAPVSSPFGMRTATDGSEAFHYGIDLAAPEGDKIKCAAEGTVTEAGETADYGNYILICHPGDIYTLYAHCEKILPSAGDAVSAGQVIATVGATGNATGPHLHFELRSGENWLDPAEFIDFEEGPGNG